MSIRKTINDLKLRSPFTAAKAKVKAGKQRAKNTSGFNTSLNLRKREGYETNLSEVEFSLRRMS